MPTQDWGVYQDSLTLGTEVSSTYEGRHITATAAELNHGNVLAVVTKGYPVIFGIAGTPYGVGVAFNTEVLGTDLIAVDTEGIWNLSVVGSDDSGASLVRAGELLYINTTTAIISKISTTATQIPFGYALGQANGDDLAHTIAVKVHFDPGVPVEFFGAKAFNDEVHFASPIHVTDATAALNAADGCAIFAGGIGVAGPSVFGGTIRIQGNIIHNNHLNCAGGITSGGPIIFNGTVNMVGPFTLGGGNEFLCLASVRFGHANIWMNALPAGDPGDPGRLWNNGGVLTVS